MKNNESRDKYNSKNMIKNEWTENIMPSFS
jgi:hypothetical protein